MARTTRTPSLARRTTPRAPDATSDSGTRYAPSDLEQSLLFFLRVAGLPRPEREVTGIVPGRQFRFDFCYRRERLLIEVDGGTWQYGRHSRPAGYASDCSKINAATLAGWRVLRFTTDMVTSGEA
ncbi:MAG: DUF559 domain-containing protein, partial [Ktedonobacterales bacterium]|nr:DUF559 domain-containing protein [Ktedonobacterales bacterium]